MLRFNDQFGLVLEKPKTSQQKNKKETLSCPKCKTGQIIKGKTAYGCSRWKEGCHFKYLFSDIKIKAKGKKLSKDFVKKILLS